MRVHLVEPNADLRLFLAFLLDHEGHQVSEAASLDEQGLVVPLLTVPLLILRVDAWNPPAQGLSALLQARVPLPTLVLTSTAETARVAAALDLPAEDCFALPLVPAALRQRVTELGRALWKTAG